MDLASIEVEVPAYLEQTVPLRIKRMLQFNHILILLWINKLVRKIDRKAFELKLHLRGEPPHQEKRLVQ